MAIKIAIIISGITMETFQMLATAIGTEKKSKNVATSAAKPNAFVLFKRILRHIK